MTDNRVDPPFEADERTTDLGHADLIRERLDGSTGE
jgi:hypothetical protein